MPLYEFTCDECQHAFETLVRRESEIPAVRCPQCEGTRVKRGLSVPARPVSAPTSASSTACPPDGSPCGAPWCRRR
jgi:putative FmdB family regulatory protein